MEKPRRMAAGQVIRRGERGVGRWSPHAAPPPSPLRIDGLFLRLMPISGGPVALIFDMMWCCSLLERPYVCLPHPGAIKSFHNQNRGYRQVTAALACHPERSEGPVSMGREILRCAQDDRTGVDC